MSENKLLKCIGWLLVAIGIVIIIARRIFGIDLTEGQLFVQDLPWWILSIGCMVGGYVVVNNAQGR